VTTLGPRQAAQLEAEAAERWGRLDGY
jgi:hypothetical protein